MPMPPPPPGPPPGPPPPPVFNLSKSKGGNSVDNRGALLQSIRQGTKLKKAVTNDKSAPMIPGKVTSNTNSNNDVGRTKATPFNSSNNAPMTNGIGLGGLFSGGMPKLRSTGLRTGVSQPSLNISSNDNHHVRRLSPESPRQNTLTSASSTTQLHEALKRQLSSDIRHRGPPPQPPIQRNNNVTDSVDSSNRYNTKTSSDNSLSINNKNVHLKVNMNNGGNPSFLHQQTNGGNTPVTPTTIPRPIISHGKPNVAPKPPPLAQSSVNKPATPPKKVAVNGRVPVSRAQSMRVPRSPPVAPPNNPPFPPSSTINGTIRGVPTAFHQSQENLTSNQNVARSTHTRNQTLPVNLNLKSVAPAPPVVSGRPSGPPPSRPPVPPPPSRTSSNVNLKAPLSPPPPPPTALSLPAQPPPPPHRTSPAPPPPPPSHSRPPPAIPSNGPPPPPVRVSSARNGPLDFDARFSNLFHPTIDFPAPCRFHGFPKVYNSRNVANKQQAPLPPNSVQLGNKLWESSTC